MYCNRRDFEYYVLNNINFGVCNMQVSMYILHLTIPEKFRDASRIDQVQQSEGYNL